ncbi:hypothetical protein LVX30_RS24570, partial [Escherichia coli]
RSHNIHRKYCFLSPFRRLCQSQEPCTGNKKEINKTRKNKHLLERGTFPVADIPSPSQKNKIIKHYLTLISLKTCG